MVAGCEQVVDSFRDAIEHAREARELAKATGKDALRMSASAEEAKARLLASDFEGALSIGRELMVEPAHTWSSEALAIAIAAAAAMSDPIEQELSEKYASLEAPAAAVAGMHTLAAFYALRSGEQYLSDLLQLPTETDRVWTRHVLRRVIFLPTLALAAARWGAQTDRLLVLAERTLRGSGHRRGEALVAHAHAVQAHDAARLESAIAAYNGLGLEFEEALGLYDLALMKAREASEDVDPLLRRARAIAEKIGAEALAASLRV
jgi:hypothetical protein